jgi:hypothetical protein
MVGDWWFEADDDKFESNYNDEEEEVLGDFPGLRRKMAEYEEFLIRRRWEIKNVREDNKSKSEGRSKSGSEKGESEAAKDVKSVGDSEEGAGPLGSVGVTP